MCGVPIAFIMNVEKGSFSGMVSMLFGAHCANLNEEKPILSVAEM